MKDIKEKIYSNIKYIKNSDIRLTENDEIDL